MRLIAHKREAYWFYRFLSLGYDRWVNPLFWTPAMRARALEEARLHEPGLTVLDAGAGTGFTTEGIVERVRPAGVTMLDQSPHQLARARAKPALEECEKVLGDAEALPFADDAFDRYVSAGSIEYWPDPQRGIAEAYRVTREGGVAVVIGPVRPANRVARWLAETWMLFPGADEYERWFRRAGFRDVRAAPLAPEWYRDSRAPYALAVSGVKPAPGPPLVSGEGPQEAPAGIVRSAARFVAGSAAGFAFVPIAAVLALRRRERARRGGGAP
jgi:MPBQ/MSBQ methyltransferase